MRKHGTSSESFTSSTLCALNPKDENMSASSEGFRGSPKSLRRSDPEPQAVWVRDPPYSTPKLPEARNGTEGPRFSPILCHWAQRHTRCPPSLGRSTWNIFHLSERTPNTPLSDRPGHFPVPFPKAKTGAEGEGRRGFGERLPKAHPYPTGHALSPRCPKPPRRHPKRFPTGPA